MKEREMTAGEAEMEKRELGLAPLQEAAQALAALIGGDILRLKERQAEDSEGLDVKLMKDLTAALKGVVDVMREVYAIPTVKEGIDLEKWEREKQRQSGEESAGGVIILPSVAKEEQQSGEESTGDVILLPKAGEMDGEEDYMDAAAEADRIHAET